MAVESTLEAYPIAPYVMELAKEKEGISSIEFSVLLEKLNKLQAKDSDKRPEYWPKTSRKLSADIRRMAPSLRKKGYSCTISDPDRERKRTVTIKGTSQTSATSATSAEGVGSTTYTADVAADVSEQSATTSADVSEPPSHISAHTSAAQSVENNQSADVADIADVSAPHLSKRPSCASYAVFPKGEASCVSVDPRAEDDGYDREEF